MTPARSTLQTRNSALAGARLVAVVLGLLAQAGTAFAQDDAPTLTVQGRVVNSTEGASEIGAGQRVQVVAFDDTGSLGSWDTATDGDGQYRVSGIPRGTGATYVVGTDYAGTSYVERVDEMSGPTVETNVAVFESAALDPGVRMERTALILSGVDDSTQTITLLEVHSLLNPTDRTFLPQADGAGGTSGLMVFGLPTHAFRLTPHLGLDPNEIVQIDRGFASLAPVRPGRTEVAFSYQFPFSESSYLLQRTLRYPADSLHVFSPAGGPTIAAEGLPPAVETVVGERRYQEIDANGLPAGTIVKLTIGALPARGGIALPIAPEPIGVAGVLAGVIAVLVAWWTARRRLATAPAEDLAIEGLITLDHDYAAGRIGEDDYVTARDRLLAQHAEQELRS